MIMAEYIHKKSAHTTQWALDKAIERYIADGWTVERTAKVPRDAASRLFIYIAYLKREKTMEP